MQRSWLQAIIGSLFFFIIGNLLFINGYLFFILPKQLAVNSAIQPAPERESNPPVVLPSSQPECGDTCQTYINRAVRDLETKLATVSAKKTSVPVATKTESTVKELFIPLGSGTTGSDQWEDIAGTDAYIDSAKYPNVQTVYFEASLRIPTKNGEVFARLYNVTDKHPVWFSDVSTTSDTSTFKGAKITLDSGNKLYRVQMRTSLRYQSILDNARVKVLLQ